ncbi:branched-chain amino acid transport system substrate-binding protein [Conyzicola lurida]|uniref:Branched-chain amino acid transport system substrate-binding protein n=1 Tax=Conyzicola lurida TaxID=1172621 RepID=A0A841AG11_9MICO|nr:ABC transporter substrate-binding protein [Conyzicola lurida]MBB5842177.1 branched-chain amino acid transport system substrate-binding protein [Conyzicola lurida]
MAFTTRKTVAFFAAATALVALAGCSSAPAASGDDDGPKADITIGVALPTTGGSAVLGLPMSQGLEMAVAAINADGGIDGANIVLVQEDSGADDASALNAFNRITSENPAAVIGFPVSTQGFAVMTQVDRTGIPVIMGGTNSKLAAGSDYAFSMTASDAITTTAAVEFAAETLGVEKIALLRESGELGTGASEIVNETAEDLGIEVVDEEIFQSGDVDLATQANNLRGSDADMLFVYGQQADYIVVANALATAGVKLPTFIAGLQGGTYAQLNYDGFDTIYNRNQCVPSAAVDNDLAAWSADYEAEYGEAPTEYAAIAYDGMNLLADALTTAGTDPEALKTALQELPSSEGICGVHEGTEEGNLSFGVTLGHYEDGAYVTDESLSVDPK